MAKKQDSKKSAAAPPVKQTRKRNHVKAAANAIGSIIEAVDATSLDDQHKNYIMDVLCGARRVLKNFQADLTTMPDHPTEDVYGALAMHGKAAPQAAPEPLDLGF